MVFLAINGKWEKRDCAGFSLDFYMKYRQKNAENVCVCINLDARFDEVKVELTLSLLEYKSHQTLFKNTV